MLGNAKPGLSAPVRVLIVEDSVLIAWDLAMQVEEHGCEVCGTAASGAAAIRLSARAWPDLILMDVNLRGTVDGVAAAEEICRRQRQVPIIFLTANGDPGLRRRIGRLGAATVLDKPVTRGELAAAVDWALRRRAA